MKNQRKQYTIKQLDEFGNVFYEREDFSFKDKQKFIRLWKAQDRVQILEQHNVFIITKSTGEELWIFETRH